MVEFVVYFNFFGVARASQHKTKQKGHRKEQSVALRKLLDNVSYKLIFATQNIAFLE